MMQGGNRESSGNPVRSVLIVYGTTEGQTRKIAEFIANVLKARGIEVELVDSAADSAALVQPICVAAIVCGSVHRHRYQASVGHFVRSNQAWLAGIPTAFVAVSLTAARHDQRSREELRSTVESFCRKAGWAPTMVRHAAGALRYSRYHWLKRFLIQRVARKQGVDTDVSRDHEYTDWDDLTRFVGEFLAATAIQQDVARRRGVAANQRPAGAAAFGEREPPASHARLRTGVNRR
jgi:menaquinone-dependent protoporphyrinogen oxidase